MYCGQSGYFLNKPRMYVCVYIYIYICVCVCVCVCVCTHRRVGRCSSVGIATRYGLDVSGLEPRWRQHFPHPPKPVLKPTQPPTKRGTGSLPGVKKLGSGVDQLPHLGPKLKKEYSLLPTCDFMACSRVTVPYIYIHICVCVDRVAQSV